MEDMDRVEHVLNSAAADSLPDEFTSRLLAELTAERRPSDRAGPAHPKRRIIFRPELVNVMIAAAATYLFVASGALKLVTALDQASLDSQVFSRLGAAVKVVGQWIGSFN
jgi:anti-sigma factor RsiW